MSAKKNMSNMSLKSLNHEYLSMIVAKCPHKQILKLIYNYNRMTILVYIKNSVIVASNKQINAISNQNYVLFSVLTADNMFSCMYTSA